MKRWFGVTVVMVGLTLGACSNSETKPSSDPVGAYTPASNSQAILGTWSDGSNTFTFDANGNYKWSEITPCAAPTCAESQRAAGSYEIRQNRVLLGGALGSNGDLSVTFSFANEQNTVTLSDGTKSWTLNRR